VLQERVRGGRAQRRGRQARARIGPRDEQVVQQQARRARRQRAVRRVRRGELARQCERLHKQARARARCHTYNTFASNRTCPACAQVAHYRKSNTPPKVG